MVAPKIRADLKKLAQIQSIDQLKRQLVGYEKRVLAMVRGVDLKGREARRKGEEKIAKLAEQLRKQSTGIEKQVRDLVVKERGRLNDGVLDLIAQLRKLSGTEAAAATSAPTSVKKTKSVAAKAKSGGTTRKRASAGAKTNLRKAPSSANQPSV